MPRPEDLLIQQALNQPPVREQGPNMVGINTPNGVQQVPTDVGIFYMLDQLLAAVLRLTDIIGTIGINSGNLEMQGDNPHGGSEEEGTISIQVP